MMKESTAKTALFGEKEKIYEVNVHPNAKIFNWRMSTCKPSPASRLDRRY